MLVNIWTKSNKVWLCIVPHKVSYGSIIKGSKSGEIGWTIELMELKPFIVWGLEVSALGISEVDEV